MGERVRKAMKFSVFVKSINLEERGVVVVATNGGALGPPLVEFVLPSEQVQDCRIGKRYTVTIEEND